MFSTTNIQYIKQYKPRASPEEKGNKLALQFHITHIDDILLLNNSKFGDLSIVSIQSNFRMQNRLRTKLCENRDHFNFHIVNFPFICGTFPTTSAYEVYISQLIHNFRACGSYHGFLDRGLLPTRMLLYQGSLLLCCSHHIERPGSSVFYWFKRCIQQQSVNGLVSMLVLTSSSAVNQMSSKHSTRTNEYVAICWLSKHTELTDNSIGRSVSTNALLQKK